MVILCIRYKISQGLCQTFLDAHRQAATELFRYGARAELSQCPDSPELFELRIQWESSQAERTFYESGSNVFSAIFDAHIEDQRRWELVGGRPPDGLAVLPDRHPWNRLSPWLSEHLHETILVEQMAEQVNMSPRTFTRVFRREFHMTPGQFLKQLRVTAAKNDLRERVESIDQIAAARGFGTASTMRRSFSRIAGIAPSQYRDNCGDANDAWPEMRAICHCPARSAMRA